MGIKFFHSSVIALLATIVLHFFSFSPYGASPHNLAIFSAFFVFLTLFRLILEKRMRNIFLLPFIGLNWIYFQSPFLLENKTEYFLRIIDEKYIDEISIFSSFSIALIYIGYYSFFNTVKPLSSSKVRFNESQNKKLIYFFILLGVLYRLGTTVAPGAVAKLSNIIQLFFYAPTIVFALYTLYLLRYRFKGGMSALHIISIGYVLFEFLIRLSTTLIANVGIIFLGVLLVYFREKRKIPIVYVLIILFILYPIYNSRKYFRYIAEKQNVELSDVDMGRNLLEKSYDTETQHEVEKFYSRENTFNKEHNRFENLSFISHVVLQHKLKIKPFLYGQTFYWLPLVPIPRIIFPGKPENLLSTDLATSYGLRGIDSSASINFPMIVEAYINFDFQGMLVLSLLFGIALKWFTAKFGYGIGDVNLLIILNSMKQFTHAEGNITLVFGAFIQVYLFWWVVLNIFNFKKDLIEVDK